MMWRSYNAARQSTQHGWRGTRRGGAIDGETGEPMSHTMMMTRDKTTSAPHTKIRECLGVKDTQKKRCRDAHLSNESW